MRAARFYAVSNQAQIARTAHRCHTPECPMSSQPPSLSDDQADALHHHDLRMQHALNHLVSVYGKPFMRTARLPGKRGAWAIASVDGACAVLKIFDASTCVEMWAMADIVTQLHACGYPTPRVLYVGQLPDGEGVYVQEWLPGQMLRTPGIWAELNADELQLLLAMLERHAQLAPGGRDWVAAIESIVCQQQGEWAVVAQCPIPAVQQILARCQQRITQLDAPLWRRDDLVIGDFGAHNILLNDRGQIAAVLDLEGAGHGDRVLDLVGLLYMVEAPLLPRVRNAAHRIATPSTVTLSAIYWIIQRLYLGIQSLDTDLAPIAQQMLAHIDILLAE